VAKGGKRPGAGRKKVERLSNPVASEKILHDVRAEELERALIAIEVARLNIKLDEKNFGVKEVPFTVSTGPLFKILDRLKCHARGNPRDTVNHQHDKPIDLNVTVSMAEIVRKVRERKQQYERNRK
jgi:hypothetical protein